MATLNLFCLFEGQSIWKTFSVDIDADEYVGCLKDAIKAKMTPEFDNIDANKLILWKVSIPFTVEEKSITMKDIEDKDKTMLLSRARLKTLFKNDPEKGNAYVVH
ncbi:hypothetical protein BGZ65_012559 [Modicella reniformis]|uniref:Crinkler effector protein N-terminal domain-containing protein n=1 Tax=Modicella reniformis TaxID=1440133 RepID=A0A9P6MK91_9FUNG|nr:hypothetical protein BGZ65_012559 [Modicella reniformis]